MLSTIDQCKQLINDIDHILKRITFKLHFDLIFEVVEHVNGHYLSCCGNVSRIG